MGMHGRFFVAGHNGLVGSEIVHWLQLDDHKNNIVLSRKETDIENQGKFFKL